MTSLVPPVSNASGFSPTRRYDLDWLRVFAFGLLIFYHVGMFYVTWDWHVKSRYSSHLIEPAMSLINPWRLALLFFISGVAVRFATDKTALKRFLPQRTTRLFVPLAFGMVAVCAPQAYAELRFRDEIAPGFLAFYPRYLGFDDFSIMVPTWNHLWYVAYVLVYTLVAVALLPALRRLAASPADRFFGWLEAGGAWRLLLIPALPFLVYQFALDPYFPTTHRLWGDWANLAHTLTIFLIGFVAAKSDRFWNAVARAMPAAVATAVVLAATGLVALINIAALMQDERLLTALLVLKTFYAWSVIVALLGLAQRFANRPGAVLTYLTTAIFPYYILHQTLIVAVGSWFTTHAVPVAVEATSIVIATVLGCALGHEAIRRVAVLRPLFGLPVRDGKMPAKAVLERTAG